MKYIVTRAFQYKGVVHPGKVLDLTEAELADPFIAEHVAPLVQGETPLAGGSPAPVLASGTPVPKPSAVPTPAAAAADDAADLTIGQLRSRLAKLGVHYTNRQSLAELAALYRQAQEAVAGSPMTPNRPTDPNATPHPGVRGA